MGARAESLAKQFETKAAEMTGVIKDLSDADWKKTTAAEKWSVGVTAHHVAGGHEGILGIVKTLAAGHAKGKLITKENAVKSAGIPFHPGAEKFYREAGLIK